MSSYRECLSIKGAPGERSPSGRRQGKWIMTIDEIHTGGPDEQRAGIKVPRTTLTQSPQPSSSSASSSQNSRTAQQLSPQRGPQVHWSPATQDNPKYTDDPDTDQATDPEDQDPEQQKYRNLRLARSGYLPPCSR